MSNDLSDNEAIFIFFFKPTDNPFIVFGNLSKKKNPNNFLQIFWGVYISCIVSHVRVIKKGNKIVLQMMMLIANHIS